MIIGIDGNEANVQNHVGVSVYTLELLKYFARQASEARQFKIFLKNDPRPALPKKNNYFTYEVVPGNVLWSQFFLPYHLLFHTKIDIFFAPAHYAPRLLKQPLVLSIHDLSYFAFPGEFLKKDLYKLKNWTAYSIKKADRIIAVSRTTKKDILAHFDLSEEKVSVIYNGFKQNKIKGGQDVLKIYNLKKKQYLLYVGTLQPRKNIPVLIRAFQKFHELHPEFQLVLTGKKGWLFEEIFEEVRISGVEGSVIFTGYETEEHLHALYHYAFCFVMPSLYEGFGIPILEAMAQGCPVISSHASSLPEIGSDAALYFDPNDVADLLERLTQLYENPGLARTLVQAGNKRIMEFSWEKCGKETLQAIEETAHASFIVQ